MSQDYSQNEAEQMTQTIAELQGKLKQASKNTTDYMEAGMRAGFVFGVSKDSGAIVENSPVAACELMAIERDELRSQVEQERALADQLVAALESLLACSNPEWCSMCGDRTRAALAQHVAMRKV